MALINCPECDREISDKAQICPNCGFPIQQKRDDSPHDSLSAMRWLSESGGYISFICPKCAKVSRIKRSAAFETRTGYKLDGEGECACGLVFREIIRRERTNGYPNADTSRKASFIEGMKEALSWKFILWMGLAWIALHFLKQCFRE